MKLTLRTLIAFLDGTMSDDDAASLRKKIRESEAIRELIQRIKSVIAQAHLPAPKTGEKGIGSDPNYSSEYIDSTLDVERVAEFEKLTIGSDILLAEVAEAHQILASLAEVDEGVSGRLRNRLYKTTESIYKVEADEPDVFPVVEDHASINEEYDDVEISQANPQAEFNLAPPKPPPVVEDPVEEKFDAPPIQSSPSITTQPFDKAGDIQPDIATFDSAPSPASIQPAKKEVSPDSSKRQSTAPDKAQPSAAHPKLFPVILATACVTALVVLIVVFAVNRANNAVAQNESSNNQEQPVDENEAKKNTSSTPGTDDDLDSKDPENADTDPGQADASNNSQSSKENNAKRLNPSDKQTPSDVAPSDKSTGKQSNGKTPTQDVAEKNASGKGAEQEAAKGEEEVLNLFKDKEYDEDDAPKKSKMGEGKDVAKTEKKNAAAKADVEAPKPPARLTDTKELMANAVKLANGDVAGAMKSAMQPTLRRTNLPEAKWVNLAQEQPVYVNDSIVALPDCQPSIEILESVRANLFGYCKIELKANEGEVLPLVVLQYGAVAFENLKDPNNTVDVLVGGKKIQVTFVDKDSRFAVTSLQPLPGSGMPDIAQLASTSGRLICKFAGEVVSLDANQVLSLSEASHETLPFKEVPSTLSAKPDTLSTSAKEIFFALSLENPVFEVAAAKAKTDSRPYLRKFAAVSSLVLEDIPALVEFLDDDQNKSFWREALLFARSQAITNGEFRQVLDNFCQTMKLTGNPGPDPKLQQQGKTWFQFLTVTADPPLANGLDRQLVDELESESLWMRVSAIQTLYAITGKTKFFRPEDKEEKRRKWVKAWEKSLQAGEIRVSTPFPLEQFK